MAASTFYEAFRRRLEDRRSALMRHKQETQESRQAVELDQTGVGSVSRVHAIQSQAMALATDRQRDVELNRIAAALQRLDDESFGACITCGEMIAVLGLEADPSTPLCIGCASSRR